MKARRKNAVWGGASAGELSRDKKVGLISGGCGVWGLGSAGDAVVRRTGSGD